MRYGLYLVEKPVHGKAVGLIEYGVPRPTKTGLMMNISYPGRTQLKHIHKTYISEKENNNW